jgi:hypothetical protein
MISISLLPPGAALFDTGNYFAYEAQRYYAIILGVSAPQRY